MTIDKLDITDVYSQNNKDCLICISKINELIKHHNQIGKIIDDKIIYHTRHIDDDITETEQKIHDLNLKIKEIIGQVEELEELTKPIEYVEDGIPDEDEIQVSEKSGQLELTQPIEDSDDARCQCKKAPQDDDTFMILKTTQLKHIINTLTLLTDEMNKLIK